MIIPSFPQPFSVLFRERWIGEKKKVWNSESDGESLHSDAVIYYLCDLSQSLNFSKPHFPYL